MVSMVAFALFGMVDTATFIGLGFCVLLIMAGMNSLRKRLENIEKRLDGNK